MSATLDLAIDLMRRASVTPDDAGCQQSISQRLQACGFRNEHLRFGQVDNLWAWHGHAGPVLVFLGHTDVVPAGAEHQWRFPPFTPTLQNNLLYGRGAADMKGSVAAMTTACERFITAHPQHQGTLALLLTSDEEGEAVDGTTKVIDYLKEKEITITWCLVGEPSSAERLGDVIKNGRRGSLTGRLTLHGIQGHVAYPHLADNPIHRFAPVLQSLCQIEWDQGNTFFPPTTFQISNIQAGTGADNVIPGELTILFNFRYSTEVTHTQLQERVLALLQQHQPLNYSLSWQHSGAPFLTTQGSLLTAIQSTLTEVCGYQAALSTAGGTSDGRFVAPIGAEVIELGPLAGTIHKANECVNVDDLDTLSTIYQDIIEKLLL